MKNVLVLGSNGHLGYNLTKELVAKGYHVKAGVRDINDESKTEHLKSLGVEIVEADLLKKHQLIEAMKDVDAVFQLAAVFNVTSKNPEQEVLEPTVQGAKNVVEACAQAQVGKLIFTSSIVAVGTVKEGDKPLTEESWNERAIEPYAIAKREAEKHAWELAKRYGVNMVAVLPATMIGPGFYRHTPSTLSFELLLKGKIPFALPITMDFVDVRDVARAHILAYENKNAKGRYICSGEPLSFKELFTKIKKLSPETKVPGNVLPKWMLGLVPTLDWIGHKLEGTPRFSSSELIKEYGARLQLVDNTRIKSDLGWTPTPIDNSIVDTLSWVRQRYV